MGCVVTGGCGFIGSHLVNRLVEMGHRVVVFDDLSGGCTDRLNPAAELIVGSVTELNLVTDATRSADWIFHTAAWPRIERSVADPTGTHHVNVTGTLNVLYAAQHNGVRRVINSSSSSVYGDQSTHLMREDMTPNPKSPTPSRAHGRAVRGYVRSVAPDDRGFTPLLQRLRPWATARGCVRAGDTSFLRMKAEGEPLTVYGDGTQTRSYTHVSDVVEANILAATASLTPGSHTVLNIGTNVETSRERNRHDHRRPGALHRAQPPGRI